MLTCSYRDSLLPLLLPHTIRSAQSTITNKSRLKLLHKREEVLQEIFSAVREPEVPIYKTGSRYEQFLEGIITESFLFILELKVTIFSRKSDADVVKQAAESATRSYKEISGRDVEFEVQPTIADDSYVFLKSIPPSCALHLTRKFYLQKPRRCETYQWQRQNLTRQHYGGEVAAARR